MPKKCFRPKSAPLILLRKYRSLWVEFMNAVKAINNIILRFSESTATSFYFILFNYLFVIYKNLIKSMCSFYLQQMWLLTNQLLGKLDQSAEIKTIQRKIE